MKPWRHMTTRGKNIYIKFQYLYLYMKKRVTFDKNTDTLPSTVYLQQFTFFDNSLNKKIYRHPYIR